MKTATATGGGTDGQQVPTRARRQSRGSSRGGRDGQEGKLRTQERYDIAVFESYVFQITWALQVIPF